MWPEDEMSSESPKSSSEWSLQGNINLWWSLDGDRRLWQERFGNLLEIADNPIVAISNEGIILELNEAAAQHIGRPKEELIHRSYLAEVQGDTAKRSLESIERKINGSQSWGKDTEVLLRKLSRRLFSWRSTRIVDLDKNVVGLICYGTDITEAHEIQQQLKRTLRELEDEKRAIDQSAIVAITDVKGNITYANEKFCELSKYSHDEIVGKNHRIINSGYHSEEFWAYFWKTISSGKVWKGEIRNKAKDGSYYWVDTTIVPFLDESGKPYRYVSIRFDVTEKKEAQRKADEERLRAVYAGRLASLGEMAAGIAHEIGTPLGTIRGRMELLQYQLEKDEIDKDQIYSITKTVTDQADRMTRIIRSVLSSARDGSKDPFKTVRLVDLVSGVLDYSTERFRKHGIELHIEKLPKDLEVHCRESQMAQVLSNLVSNACDAIKDLSERWIEFQALREGNFCELRIVDSGKGIPEKVIQQMMEPFFTTKGVGKGTGLGLSISKSIVEEHGGTITIDHNSKNTCFVISLPLSPQNGHFNLKGKGK